MAATGEGRKLRILHVLRAPLGGLFRHVVDLAREQASRGHEVGLVTDSTTGGLRAAATLADLSPSLALGVSRVAMHRNPHPTDIPAQAHVMARVRALDPDVVHGHGSKGALYARLPALTPFGGRAVRAYTPHGGSFNYKPGSALHRLYMAAERALARGTDVFLFESRYIAGRFHRFVCDPGARERIALNGISAAEFVPVAPKPDAAEFLYVGELRSAKGIDTLLQAFARLSGAPRLALVGSGPDEALLTAQAQRLRLADRVVFHGPMPAREAFRLGRVMVVPSRAESLPYIVLEAAGARAPLVSTHVGGIPEIFGPYADRLIPPDHPALLSERMARMLALDPAQRQRESEELAGFVESRFSIAAMTDSVLDAYDDAIARRARRSAAAPRSSIGAAATRQAP